MTASSDQNQGNGPADPPPGNGAPPADPQGYGAPREDEVSLLDILLVLARHKTLIVRTVLVFALLGVTYALLAPEEYTSSTKVVREAQQESGGLPGGISSGALSGLGINLGGAASGLTPAAYPDVLKSREVRLSVVRDTFRFPDAERPMTFVQYSNRPPSTLSKVLEYTVWLPWTLKSAVGRLIAPSSPTPAGTTASGDPVLPSKEEESAMKTVGGMITATTTRETGLMRIAVTAGGPQLASDLTKSFLSHFRNRVREIRTEKVRERLSFVEGRFEEVEKELETAENRLAQFLERNQNPTTPTLQFRRDRLQRQVSFKEQLYSELQSQLTQTRLDLQRQQPVVTVVEEPAPPRSRSFPNRTLIVLLSLILGGVLGIAGALVKSLFRVGDREEEREKIDEIQAHLLPERWRTASTAE